MYMILGTTVVGLVVLLGLIGYFGLFRAPKGTNEQDEASEKESSGNDSPKKKKENKLLRSRKGSQSVHHPMYAADLKGHTRTVVDMDFDINNKFVATASEGVYW